MQNVIKIDPQWMTSYTYEQITIGDTAKVVRTLTLEDIQAFAAVSFLRKAYSFLLCISIYCYLSMCDFGS